MIHRTISQPDIKFGKTSVILAGIVVVAVGEIQLANTGPFFVDQKTQIIGSQPLCYVVFITTIPAILQPVTEIQPLTLVTRTETHRIALQAIVIIIRVAALEQG